MMTQQQQRILVRSALATGVTLAIGLVGVGFATGPSPRATSAPATAGVVAVQAAEQSAPAQDASLAMLEGTPVDSAMTTAREPADEPREFARASEHEDDEWYDDDDDDDDGDGDDGEHREREGGGKALKRAFERREHR